MQEVSPVSLTAICFPKQAEPNDFNIPVMEIISFQVSVIPATSNAHKKESLKYNYLQLIPTYL